MSRRGASSRRVPPRQSRNKQPDDIALRLALVSLFGAHTDVVERKITNCRVPMTEVIGDMLDGQDLPYTAIVEAAMDEHKADTKRVETARQGTRRQHRSSRHR